MPNYTSNLNLEKPFQNENYNIDIFNSNSDKIDGAIKEIKTKLSGLDGIELKAEKITIADRTNVFSATNVENALLENKNSILSLQNELGTNKAMLQNNINSIREVL